MLRSCLGEYGCGKGGEKALIAVLPYLFFVFTMHSLPAILPLLSVLFAGPNSFCLVFSPSVFRFQLHSTCLGFCFSHRLTGSDFSRCLNAGRCGIMEVQDRGMLILSIVV